LTRRHGALLSIGLLVGGGCADDSEPQVGDVMGRWSIASGASTAEWLQIPSGRTLVVELDVTSDGLQQIVVTLGCSRIGGTADGLNPVDVPQPTIQGEACPPDVGAAERRMAELILDPATKIRVVDERLDIERNGAAATLT